MGYISLSRVEMADNSLLAQPFAPMLFRQGPQPGPQRTTLPQDDWPQRRTDIKIAKKEAKVELKELAWTCCSCEEY